MDYFSASWILALVAFLLGAGVGIALFKFKFSDDVRANKLEDELKQVTQDFEAYKKEVTSHFSKTSELMNNLTEDYVKVYKHLATSSESLADVQMAPQLSAQKSSPMVSFINDVEEATTHADDDEKVEAPKDYAPKSDSGEGTLSESYSVGAKKTEPPEKQSA